LYDISQLTSVAKGGEAILSPIESVGGRGAFSIAIHAVQSFWIAIGRMPRLIVSTLVVAVLVEFGIAAVAVTLPSDYQFLLEYRNTVTRSFSLDQFVLTKLFELPTIIARAIVFAPLAVAIHRLILLDDVTTGFISLRPARTRRFILWLVLVQLILMVPSFLRPSAQPSFATVALSVGLLVFSIVAFVRLTLIFPAIAIESKNGSWETIWHLTQGHFWRIVLPVLCVFLPFFVIGLPLLFLRAGAVNAAQLGIFVQQQKFQPLLVQSPDILFRAVIGVVLTGLAAAVASWLYIALSRRGPG
jgi:hypothetical protein